MAFLAALALVEFEMAKDECFVAALPNRSAGRKISSKVSTPCTICQIQGQMQSSMGTSS